MSINTTGLVAKVNLTTVSISLPKSHPLLLLREILPWESMYALIEPDLKVTKKGFWHLGRPLQVRTHLGVYILQKLYNLTDRRAEYGVKDNAAYQLFCGCDVVQKWHGPDHTKIEDFRSKLTPEIQRSLNDLILQHAVKLGFADPSKMDVDSTVQGANMSYPSDVNLLKKLAIKCNKIRSFIAKHIPYPSETVEQMRDRIKKISSLVKEYLFRNSSNEESKLKKKEALETILEEVSLDVHGLITMPLHEKDAQNLPWNIKRSLDQIKSKAKSFLLGVQFFIEANKGMDGKPLCFHLNEVACFNKGEKSGKPLQFGRAFQLGRIGGNFLICFPSSDVRMEDKHNVKNVISFHQKLFGMVALRSAGLDKGYFSNANQKFLKSIPNLKEICLQKPGLDIAKLETTQKDLYTRLADRRSGIEPLIGHAKHGGQLGKSRMKKDSTSLAAGYAAVLGLNLRQMIRHAAGKKILAMT